MALLLTNYSINPGESSIPSMRSFHSARVCQVAALAAPIVHTVGMRKGALRLRRQGATQA